MSFGTLPPASTHFGKYHWSHRRGFSPPSSSVARIENNAAASRPLHNAPEP
jgi:hypothetical protein